MPYKLGKSSSCPASKPYAVLKQDGTPVACHTTRKRAVAHLRALKVNVEDADQAAREGTATNLTRAALRRLFG
jgi:hypothetical protein